MTLGLISDTHGFLDPRVEKIFAGVDHILHAGDIGPDLLIAQLGAIAPVTAVLGNNDSSPSFRLTETVVLAERKFLLHHIVNPRSPSDELKTSLRRAQPHVVVFGHTHKPFNETIGGVWFLNPGYAGSPRFNQPRSVALLDFGKGKFSLRFVELP
ncbi:MAG: metallophosphoesterase [Pedosphaera sp.]|nr:metallophosphoesterase [Pedosphaera sp.]